MASATLTCWIDHRLGRCVHLGVAVVLGLGAVLCAGAAALVWNAPGALSRWSGGAILAASAAILAVLALRSTQRQRLTEGLQGI